MHVIFIPKFIPYFVEYKVPAKNLYFKEDLVSDGLVSWSVG